MIRPAEPLDSPSLIRLATATGLFLEGEADSLLGQTLDDLHAGRLGKAHFASVWVERPGGAPRGWVYFAENARSAGVWDLWWIGVDPEHQGRGIGRDLLLFVEQQAAAAGGRVLLIETSSLPSLARTREFYLQRGYHECGVVPDFYADGDGKVTFAKRLAR